MYDPVDTSLQIIEGTRSHLLKGNLQKTICIVYWGDTIIQVKHCPSDQTITPSETKINQHEERPNKGFPPKPSMILASRKSYQKTSSNGLDLAELEPKPVDIRQIPIDPVTKSTKSFDFCF